MWWRIPHIEIILSIRLQRLLDLDHKSRLDCNAWLSLSDVISHQWVVLMLKDSLLCLIRFWKILGISLHVLLPFSSGRLSLDWSIVLRIILRNRCFCRDHLPINWCSACFKIYVLLKMEMMRIMESTKQLQMRCRLSLKSTLSLIKLKSFNLHQILSNIRIGNIVKEVYAHLRFYFWGYLRTFLRLWSIPH